MMSWPEIVKVGRLGANLLKLSFVNPRGLREVAGVALSVAESVMDPAADVLPIPAVTIEEIVADEMNPLPVLLQVFPQQRFSISVFEAVALGVLMRKAGARRVFEFGTHRGVSTTQLASNVQEDGEVFTLDLPRSDRRTQIAINHAGDKEVSEHASKADLIPSSLHPRIRFLEADSAILDITPYRGAMDFVFVDAAHVAEYVKNDTEKAWAMLRPGGMVVWHDCRPQTPDVVHYLRHCSHNPKRVVGTTLAFAWKPVNDNTENIIPTTDRSSSSYLGEKTRGTP